MGDTQPVGELDARFSSAGATATEWAQARDRFDRAEVYWISTVRPDGRPHVTPLIAVWLDGSAYFCTGPDERKARNLAQNPHCILTTGSNAMGEGLDVVIEGEAVRVTDEATLRRLADAWVAKYGEVWRFAVRDGAFAHQGEHVTHKEVTGVAYVFEVAPSKAFAFGRGEEYSQTRWRF
jgi:general stress protein 26